jgi:periplasmic mercuric ion binding protein
MKTIKFIIATLFAVAIASSSFAQMDMKMHDHSKMAAATKTETVKVWGNCGSCKARIEKTAKVDGVTKALWDAKIQVLTLTYDPSKVKVEDIQKKIAAVGHDTEMFKADDKAYAALPGCCKYDRKK